MASNLKLLQLRMSLGLIAFCTIALTLVACNSGWTADIIGTPVVFSPTATPLPSEPHKVIVFCDDETGSYSPSNFHNAANQFATWVQGLDRPNTSGATVYVQWIDSNSYQDSSTYYSFEIPPIPAKPALPGPAPTAYPMHPIENATAYAGATDTAVSYSTVGPAWQAQFDQTKQAITNDAQKIQRISFHDSSSSDIWGCFQRATERFAERPDDQKYLVIASDMQPAGLQERGPVKLYGASVIVIYFETSDVGVADSYKAYWTSHIQSAGGQTPKFYRPSDILPQQLF